MEGGGKGKGRVGERKGGRVSPLAGESGSTGGPTLEQNGNFHWRKVWLYIRVIVLQITKVWRAVH